MTLGSDTGMTLTSDELAEFEALLGASGLGAPHVRAQLQSPLPASVGEHLDAAASGRRLASAVDALRVETRELEQQVIDCAPVDPPAESRLLAALAEMQGTGPADGTARPLRAILLVATGMGKTCAMRDWLVGHALLPDRAAARAQLPSSWIHSFIQGCYDGTGVGSGVQLPLFRNLRSMRLAPWEGLVAGGWHCGVRGMPLRGYTAASASASRWSAPGSESELIWVPSPLADLAPSAHLVAPAWLSTAGWENPLAPSPHFLQPHLPHLSGWLAACHAAVVADDRFEPSTLLRTYLLASAGMPADDHTCVDTCEHHTAAAEGVLPFAPWRRSEAGSRHGPKAAESSRVEYALAELVKLHHPPLLLLPWCARTTSAATLANSSRTVTSARLRVPYCAGPVLPLLWTDRPPSSLHTFLQRSRDEGAVPSVQDLEEPQVLAGTEALHDVGKAAPPFRVRIRREGDGSWTVGITLHARLLTGLGDPDHAVTVPTQMTYRSRDPYAVETRFAVGAGEVTWVFARDLALTGVRYGQAGIGDVQFRHRQPEEKQDEQRTVRMRLSSPGGEAELSFHRRQLSSFLDATCSVVPHGSESLHVQQALTELEAAVLQPHA